MGENLTVEQKQALDELVRLVEKQHPAQVQPRGGSSPDVLGDLLETWLGISREETAGYLTNLLSQKDALQHRFLDWAANRPLDAVFEFLAAASMAFYAAEKGVNPKVKTYIDAFYYISTCASVGYADIFAVTQTGRTIAALVMIVGPAFASHALDRPNVPSVRSDQYPPGKVPEDRKEMPNGNAA